jgi:hypothetical protein
MKRTFEKSVKVRYFPAVFLIIALLFIFKANCQNITKVECFIDTDPGFGLGINVPVTPAANISNLQFTIGLGGVPVGFHTFYVRAKDAGGHWSLSHVQAFYKSEFNAVAFPNITRAEYFIDTDPGFGMGVNIPVTPGTNLNNLQFAIGLGAVPTGFHTLYVRAKDANGRWSFTHAGKFYKPVVNTVALPNVTKVEYFFDNDPGMGMGTNVPVTPSTNINNLSFIIDLNSLPLGPHTVLIRAKDGYGKWSQVAWSTFTQEVVPVSVSILASANQVCAGFPVTITATPVNGGANPTFQWKVNGVIVGANNPIYSYNPSNGDVVSCMLTSSLINAVGNPATSNVLSIAVYPGPTPTITGVTTVCSGTTGVVYTTEAGKTWYNWSVSSGGTITSVIGLNTITVTWNTVGSQTVSVNYPEANGCSAPSPTVLNVAVNGVPGQPGIVSGPISVCQGALGENYSVSPVPNATSYVWTIPAWVTLTAGAGTSSITVNFPTPPNAGTFSVKGTNVCGSGIQSPGLMVTSRAMLTGDITLNNVIIPSAHQECRANHTITTAGSGTTFVVQGGGDITMIASEFVRFLPGTTVQQNGLLHAYISTHCVPCNLLKIPASDSGLLISGQPGEVVGSRKGEGIIKVYPNPTPGDFTLELIGKSGTDKLKVEIYSSHGEKILSEVIAGNNTHGFSLANRPAGVYFMRVISGTRIETVKVVKGD